MNDLVCPLCGKLLGRCTVLNVAKVLRLWCRRCRAEVVPRVIESKSKRP